jgi:2-iminobutanoate/2-iminopropanoate deaminase
MNEVIKTDTAPKAIGPYSQAIRAGSFLFVSGQIALEPLSGKLLEGDAALQAEQVMQNLGAILSAAKLDFDRVVKATIYLTDLADYAAVNEVYGRRFPHAPPARSTVQVSALPRGARVEIDLIACA